MGSLRLILGAIRVKMNRVCTGEEIPTMKPALLVLFLALCLLTGCSLKVLPVPVASGTIDPQTNSQTITRDGIAITVGSTEPEFFTNNLSGAIAAFSVQIANRTDGEIAFDIDSFLLLDAAGRQYFPLTPEKVKEIISRDTYYLIPYPYVGFYYLEDYERASAINSMSSQLPYFYEVYPQDIATRALHTGTIIPQATVAGLLYFRIDLEATSEVKLLAFRKGASKSAPPDFVFPFRISK